MMDARELLVGLTLPGGRHFTRRHEVSCLNSRGDCYCPEHAHDLFATLMDEHKGISETKNRLANEDMEALKEL